MMHFRLSLSTQQCISVTLYTIWCIYEFHCQHNDAFLLHITQYDAFPTFTFHTTMLYVTYYTIWCISDFHYQHNDEFLLHITQYDAFIIFTVHTVTHFCYTLHNMMYFRIPLSTQRCIFATHNTLWCIPDFHCPHNDAFLLHITQYDVYINLLFHTTMHFCSTLHNMMHF